MHTSQTLKEAGMGVLLNIPSSPNARSVGSDNISKSREGRSFDQTLFEARRELSSREPRQQAGVDGPRRDQPRTESQPVAREQVMGPKRHADQRQETAAAVSSSSTSARQTQTNAGSSPPVAAEEVAETDNEQAEASFTTELSEEGQAEDIAEDALLLQADLQLAVEELADQAESSSLAELAQVPIHPIDTDEALPQPMIPVEAEADSTEAQRTEAEQVALDADLLASVTAGGVQAVSAAKTAESTTGDALRGSAQQSGLELPLNLNKSGQLKSEFQAQTEVQLEEGDLEMPAKTDFVRLLASEGAKTVAREAGSGQPSTPQANAAMSFARAAEPLLSAARTFVPQTLVTTTLGQPQWSQAVGDKVLWLASQNLTSAELRLDPPDLGPVQVRVVVQNDQAQVTFTSPHASVREALDQSAARLRELFSEQGLNLNMDVSDQSFARDQSREEPSSGGAGQQDAGADEQLIQETSIQQVRLVDHYA